MCGIFGVVDFDSADYLKPSIIDACTDRLAHRGPDGRGVWLGAPAALGHRRLAIIDPQGSPQPMVSSDGRHILTFNGEIYNYREIRDRLEDLGCRFRTDGDTEVVLQAVVTYGAETAAYMLNGMFAFGLWDRKAEKLTLTRDRIGVKPLLYSLQGSRLIFASEFSALLVFPTVSKTPDPLGLTAFLAHFQTSFNGNTVFRDIRSLQPGTVAVFSRQGFTHNAYWQLPVIPSDKRRNAWPDERIPEAAREVRRLMTRAVGLNSVADVEVGAFLSGGLDSSIIISEMAKPASSRVKAYSVGFAERGFNEFEYSQPLVDTLGLEHTLITLKQDDYRSLMSELICRKAAPLSTPNEVPIYALAQHAAKDLKVVLSGEGSDELFGGYSMLLRSPYDLASAERLRNQPQAIPPHERQARRDALRRLYGRSGFKGLSDHWRTSYAWLNRNDLVTLLSPDVGSATVFEEIDAFWENRFARLDGLDTYDKYLHILESEHLRGLIERLDADTMAASLEGRVPFTENDLIEFVAGLPFEYKLRWKSAQAEAEAVGKNSLEIAESLDTGKFILKEAFRESIPARIIERKKAAFPVPLDLWLREETPQARLSEVGVGLEGIVNRSRLPGWIEGELATGYGGMKVFMLWSLAQWRLQA